MPAAALLELLALPPTQGSGTNAMALGLGGAAAEGGASGRQLANVLSMRAFFEALVAEFVAAVEALAISEVHAWLVSAVTGGTAGPPPLLACCGSRTSLGAPP